MGEKNRQNRLLLGDAVLPFGVVFFFYNSQLQQKIYFSWTLDRPYKHAMTKNRYLAKDPQKPHSYRYVLYFGAIIPALSWSWKGW